MLRLTKIEPQIDLDCLDGKKVYEIVVKNRELLQAMKRNFELTCSPEDKDNLNYMLWQLSCEVGIKLLETVNPLLGKNWRHYYRIHTNIHDANSKELDHLSENEIKELAAEYKNASIQVRKELNDGTFVLKLITRLEDQVAIESEKNEQRNRPRI